MLSKRYANDGIACLKLNEVQKKQKLKIQAHLDCGKYAFEKTDCAICGDNHFEQLSQKDRYGLKMPIAICLNCGLIQATPRMTQESYQHFYNDGHRRLYVGMEKPNEAYFQGRYRAGKSTYEYLSQHISIQNKHILEVGCGSGAILKYLHDNGAKVKGIDLSQEYLEYGKQRYGLDLSNTNLFDLPEKHQFDLIIYSDVLEHIINPHEHLKKIKELLKPDGLLYLKVPGTKNIVRPYLCDFLKSIQNAHVYYYSLATLNNLASNCGYSMIHGNEEIRSLWRVDNKVSYKQSNDYSDCMKFLRKIEKKRFTRNLLPLVALGFKTIQRLILK